MRKEDIRWNHLYLSATPYIPLTLVQNFANGFAWFASFREMLNFRVGAMYYKRKEKNELSKHCSTMAAYLTMFQLILKQRRLYEFSTIIDNYNKEKTYSLVPSFLKPVKDSTSGRDALATAKNMELLSDVTEVLKEVMDYRTVRQQYPVGPSDPYIFPTNQEQAKTRKSAASVVKETLASDFYLQEAPENEEESAKLAKKLEGLALKEPSLEVSHGAEFGTLEEIQSQQPPTENPVDTTESKEQGASSKVSEEIIAKKEEPSEQEKEILWLKHSQGLKTIDQKYNLLEEDDEVLYRKYYKYVWKELLAIYGDAFVQVTEYFHFAISGRSYRSTVEKWTDTFEDYVPNMEESVAIWEKAQELYDLTKADYRSEKSSQEKGWKSHPVTVLQSIEKIRYTNRIKDAEIDEERIQKKWTLEYVDPRENPADLKVVKSTNLLGL